MPLLKRKCFNYENCKNNIEVWDHPVACLGGAGVIKPKLDGPWICLDCRKESSLLKEARKLMEAKFKMKFPSPSSWDG